MRYRKLSPTGDFVFGTGAPFLSDSAKAVAQAVATRMRLYAGEWFLDKREGLDQGRVLGYGTQSTRDREIQQRILGTPGALRLTTYSSSMEGRAFRVVATLETIYGPTTIDEVL